MPMYEYLCTKCDNRFTVVLTISEHEKKKTLQCPHCHSKDVMQQLQAFFAKTSKKS